MSETLGNKVRLVVGYRSVLAGLAVRPSATAASERSARPCKFPWTVY